MSCSFFSDCSVRLSLTEIWEVLRFRSVPLSAGWQVEWMNEYRMEDVYFMSLITQPTRSQLLSKTVTDFCGNWRLNFGSQLSCTIQTHLNRTTWRHNTLSCDEICGSAGFFFVNVASLSSAKFQVSFPFSTLQLQMTTKTIAHVHHSI